MFCYLKYKFFWKGIHHNMGEDVLGMEPRCLKAYGIGFRVKIYPIHFALYCLNRGQSPETLLSCLHPKDC